MTDTNERMTKEEIDETIVYAGESDIAEDVLVIDLLRVVVQLRADLKEVTNEAVALRMQYESALDMVLQETGEKLNALKKLRFAESAYEDHITIKQDLAAANKKLRVAEDVVERLPKTADGVPVVPGMNLYEAQLVFDEIQVRKVESVCMRTFPDSAVIEDCYFTREAAEDARSPQP